MQCFHNLQQEVRVDTIVLYVLARTGLLVSALKDRAKTKTALLKAAKAFEGILPQFLVVLALVAASLAQIGRLPFQ